MKTITTLTAKPLNYAIIKSDKSKTGEFIKITFLVEKEQDDKGNLTSRISLCVSGSKSLV